MKKSKKEYEREIMRRMAEEDGGSGNAQDGPEEDAPAAEETEEEFVDERDSRKCPRCYKEVGSAKVCPHCGYNGYIPMSKRGIMRIRLILWPVLLAIAAVIYFILKNK
ncbi:MAG: hypothetical protein J6252_05080 [Clostridia bacterium]|nr:hypothetical protein [Clostridia bacterium]